MSDSSDEEPWDVGSFGGTPKKSLRLSMSRADTSPSRFSLSPSRRSVVARGLPTKGEQQVAQEAITALSKVMEWESPSNENEPLGLLQLPDRFLEGGSEVGDVPEMLSIASVSGYGTAADGLSSCGDSLHGDRTSVLASRASVLEGNVDAAAGNHGEYESKEQEHEETGGSEEDFGDAEDGSTDTNSFVGRGERLSCGSALGGNGGVKIDVKSLKMTVGETGGWTSVARPKSPEEVQEMFERAIRLSEVHVDGPGNLSEDDDQDDVSEGLPEVLVEGPGNLSDDDNDDTATIEYNDDDTVIAAIDDSESSRVSTDHPEGREEKETARGQKRAVMHTPSVGDDSLLVSSSDDQDLNGSRYTDGMSDGHYSSVQGERRSKRVPGAGAHGYATAEVEATSRPPPCPLVWNVTFEVPENSSQHGIVAGSTHSLPVDSSHSMRSADLACSEVLSTSEGTYEGATEKSEQYSCSDAAPETVSDIVGSARDFSEAASENNTTMSDFSHHLDMTSGSGHGVGVEGLSALPGSGAARVADDTLECRERPGERSLPGLKAFGICFFHPFSSDA